MQPAETALVFLHIPKTGGSTLSQVAHRQYVNQPNFTLYREHPSEGIPRFLELSESQRARLRFVMGHGLMGVHKLMPQPARYITMIREPREHAVSRYFYQRETSPRTGPNAIPSIDFEAYVKKPRVASFQLDDLLGIDVDSATGEVKRYAYRKLPVDEKLALAEHNLRTHFALVGLVEHFDASLLMMRKAFGWQNVYYVRRNTNAKRPRDPEELARLYAMVEEYIQPDLQLYAMAKRIYTEQAAAYGPTLAADVQRFQRNNARFARVYALTQGLRRTGAYRVLRRRGQRP